MLRSWPLLLACLLHLCGIAQTTPQRSDNEEPPPFGPDPSRHPVESLPIIDSLVIARHVTATSVFMADLRDGRTAGLSRFFADPAYFASVRPSLDSLAKDLVGKSHEPAFLGHRPFYEYSRVAARLVDDQDTALVHIEFDYAPDDRVGRVVAMHIMPHELLLRLMEVEEPPPTQQMLEKEQKR